MSDLRSSNDTATRQAIMEFVAAAADEGSAGFVPPEERIAVFDNDGTLWAEKPMPVQLGFALKRLAETADTDASLRDRQPWKAAAEGDHAWLASVVDKHSAGDDSLVKVLLGGILREFSGMAVTDYVALARAFVTDARHPTLGRPYASVRVPADDRAAAGPRGQRLRER